MKTREFQPDTVSVQKLIVCTKERRGDGKQDPIRVILEVFTIDGEKIAEYDPCACAFCGKFNCSTEHK